MLPGELLWQRLWSFRHILGYNVCSCGLCKTGMEINITKAMGKLTTTKVAQLGLFSLGSKPAFKLRYNDLLYIIHKSVQYSPSYWQQHLTLGFFFF